MNPCLMAISAGLLFCAASASAKTLEVLGVLETGADRVVEARDVGDRPHGRVQICLINRTNVMKSLTFDQVEPRQNGMVVRRSGDEECRTFESGQTVEFRLRDLQRTRFRKTVDLRAEAGNTLFYYWEADSSTSDVYHVRTLTRGDHRVYYTRQDGVAPEDKVRICLFNQTVEMKSLTFEAVSPPQNGMVAMADGTRECRLFSTDQRITFRLRDKQVTIFNEAMSLQSFGAAQVNFQWWARSSLVTACQKQRCSQLLGAAASQRPTSRDGSVGAAAAMLCLLACEAGY